MSDMDKNIGVLAGNLERWVLAATENISEDIVDAEKVIKHFVIESRRNTQDYAQVFMRHEDLYDELVRNTSDEVDVTCESVRDVACLSSIVVYYKMLYLGVSSSTRFGHDKVIASYALKSYISHGMKDSGAFYLFDYMSAPFHEFAILGHDIKNEMKSIISEAKGEKDAIQNLIHRERSVVEKIVERYVEVRDASYDKLSDSFSGFRERKERERDAALNLVKWLGVLSVVFAIITITFCGFFSVVMGSFSDGKIISHGTFSLVVVEVLLIYFFRISLQNYYAARDEAMQIDIREALCRFAPHYTAFYEKTDGCLDDFARHVFSPLTSKMNDAPHPVDVVGNVGKIAKEIVKSKK